MSAYLDEKVKEALIAARGAKGTAQKTLMVWAMKDPRLLQAMAMPFIKAIAGAAIEGALKRGVPVPGRPARPAPQLSRETLDQVLSQMGKADSAQAPAELPPQPSVKPMVWPAKKGGAAVPATRPSAPAKPAASRGPESAIQALAAAYAKKP
ncbi:MAG: hypothetical protein GC191_09760 [Azospirillum sp.]|nr:hypothetical protein [Azospirillum sp.]